MADGGELETRRYSAFISYSHDDAPFARRLHRTLEGYRLPRRLSQESPGRGGDARRLRPIFRDRDELSAASDLSQAVQAALAESSALIVVCSPHAARSLWVGREVALFRRLHAGGAILAALIDGEPDEAFPPALCAAGPGGAILQPLAADFRRGGDGARLALLKLVAVLAGVRLDELVQRDAHRRVRQATLAGAAALAGMAAMGALALVAVRARNVAEQERNRGETLIDFMLTDLRGKLKGVGRLDLLDAVNQGAVGYYRGQDLARMADTELAERAKLLQIVGNDDEKRGLLSEARGLFDEAARTTKALLDQAPNDEGRIFAHAQSEYWIGENAWRSGRHAETEAAFDRYRILTERLIKAAPLNPSWLIEVGEAYDNLGTAILRDRLDLATAATDFTKALGYYQAGARLRNGDPDAQAGVLDVYGWLGDIERLQGHCDAARQYRQRQRTILQTMLKDAPSDADIRSQLVSNGLALARIDMCSGNLASAIAEFEAGHTAAMALSVNDAANLDVARQVRAYDLFTAQAWLEMAVSAQPPAQDLRARIGDCSAEATRPHNDEVAFFCLLLSTRLRLQNDRKNAESGLPAVSIPQPLRGVKLTTVWGLPVAEEMRWATGGVQRMN